MCTQACKPGTGGPQAPRDPLLSVEHGCPSSGWALRGQLAPRRQQPREPPRGRATRHLELQWPVSEKSHTSRKVGCGPRPLLGLRGLPLGVLGHTTPGGPATIGTPPRTRQKGYSQNPLSQALLRAGVGGCWILHGGKSRGKAGHGQFGSHGSRAGGSNSLNREIFTFCARPRGPPAAQEPPRGPARSCPALGPRPPREAFSGRRAWPRSS